ncbi:hypothetical protein [Candidatus Nucleicultrix amoebiphila]|uniref:Uncharacterized protein n=1 Tax=Candidatus Nucleicultrix amoebiphila FS5 TaxID=1414854 RepID=A0A1W6N2P4_9PROT|nr:hypothetical protein [Candidatus Nucleicultrix amoebiphila]ARN84056.1 hypothetical protein GQ61_00355 [Candidatus Nucleicultrix amoebiphila FS5]
MLIIRFFLATLLFFVTNVNAVDMTPPTELEDESQTIAKKIVIIEDDHNIGTDFNNTESVISTSEASIEPLKILEEEQTIKNESITAVQEVSEKSVKKVEEESALETKVVSSSSSEKTVLGVESEESTQTPDEQSIALAKKILAEEIELAKQERGFYLPYLEEPLLDEDKKFIGLIREQFAKIPFDSNVHSMTVTFARTHYSRIKKIEQSYLKITTDATLKSIKEIKEGLESYMEIIKAQELELPKKDVQKLTDRMPAIAKMLTQIESVYWNNPTDGETTVNLKEVFSHTYTLAQTYGPDYLGLLCEKLAENYETQGGCHPGVNGRLVAFYFTLLTDAIGEIK